MPDSSAKPDPRETPDLAGDADLAGDTERGTADHVASSDDVLATRRANQRSRSLALAIILGGFVALLFAVTIVKLGPGILERPL